MHYATPLRSPHNALHSPSIASKATDPVPNAPEQAHYTSSIHIRAYLSTPYRRQGHLVSRTENTELSWQMTNDNPCSFHSYSIMVMRIVGLPLTNQLFANCCRPYFLIKLMWQPGIQPFKLFHDEHFHVHCGPSPSQYLYCSSLTRMCTF